MKTAFKAFFVLALFVLLPAQALAAIGADTAASYTACVTGTTCYYSFTVTGSNPFLACMTSNYTTSPGTVTMQYASTSMTEIGSQQTNNTGSNNFTSDTFYLAAPPTGTHNLVITTTNSMTNGFYVHCASYTGVNQTSPIDTSTQHNTTYPASGDSATITTTADNSFVVGFWGDLGGRTHSAGSGTTQRTSDGQGAVEDGGGAVSPAGSKTISITDNAATGYTLTAFGLKAM
jgi:hypothetical protein